MTKLNKIKSLEDFKKYNIICTTTEEVRECLKMLNTRDQNKEIIDCDNERIVCYDEDNNRYLYSLYAFNEKDISFYNFKKIYNRLKKQQEQEQKLGPLVKFITGKINVLIEDGNDYDNIIDYLDKRGVIWNIGRPLKDLNYKGEALSVILENVNGVYRLLYTNETNIDKVKIESSITVKELFKRFNIQYKKLPSDFEVDENGRVIKINNYKSKIEVYSVSPQFSGYYATDPINNLQEDYLERLIKFGSLFSTEGTAKKYIKYIDIHIKLKNLANRLNNGEKINFNNIEQIRYSIYFDYKYDKICQFDMWEAFKDTVIYCLDKNFKDEALKEIGEDDLKWYLQRTY